MRSMLFAPLLAAALAPLSTLAAEPQEAFWSRLHSLCGQAFAGRVIDPQPQDATFAGEALVMQVRDCGEREIRIPFQVGANRSRTWVLTRTPEGLRLKHEHRHPDGSEDRVTQSACRPWAPSRCTSRRVLRHWTHALPHTHNKRQPEHWLPKAVLDDLPALDADLAGLVRLHSRHPAEDGSERLLLALADGQTVEAVLLPPRADAGAVRVQPGRLRGGLPFCMTGAGRPAAPARQRRDRRPGGAGAAPAAGATRWCSWAWASRRTTWTTCSRPSSCSARQAASATRTWSSRPWATSASSSACRPGQRTGQAGAGAVAAHHRSRRCASELLPRAPSASTPAELVNWPTPTPAPPATRCSTSGRCWTASTTATTNSTASCACWASYGVLNLIPWNTVDGLPFRAPAGNAPPRWRGTCTAAAS
jgi:hypothetical protein